MQIFFLQRCRLAAILLLTGLAVAISSCSYRQNQVLFSTPQGYGTSKNADSATYEYRIQAQDVIQLRNLQNISTLTDITGAPAGTPPGTILQPQSYQVKNDGYLKLPVLGDVKVAGLTIEQATEKVQGLYSKNVLKDPIIDLKIISLKVTILGEVKVPGNYPLASDKTNIVDLIGQAGGLTEKADEHTIKIVRGGLQNPEVIMINLGNLKMLSTPSVVLRSNDIVYVLQNKKAIQNEKISTLSAVLQPALILINTALIIFTLTRK